MAKVASAGTAITHRDRLPSTSRYELLVKIASGGMATVYVGRLSSVVGTSRLVAIKRAHAHLLEDPMFSKMLIGEAKLASRIHHPNVVAVQNVEEADGELLLVMDYVEGASLSDLAGDDEVAIPGKVAVRAILDACAGLQAAHDLTDDDGKPLGIVHRDVSPHNILVGVDGITRITDFGIAKSSGHTANGARTTTGALKGKVSYMAPEYIEHGEIDAKSDVFSLGIVAWESLTRTRLFRGGTEIESLKLVLTGAVPKPSEIAPWLGRGLDKVILKALARSPAERFGSASELGEALEQAARRDDLIATPRQVGKHVLLSAGDALSVRRVLLRERPLVPENTGETASTLVDEAPPALAEDSVVPRAQDSNTASFVQHDSASKVRSMTARMPSAPAPGAAGRGGPGGTLPFGTTPPLGAREPVMEARASEDELPHDSATFGSGVSAHLVGAVRMPRKKSPLRSGLLVALVALGIVVGGLTVLTLSRSSSPDPQSKPAAAPPNLAPASGAPALLDSATLTPPPPPVTAPAPSSSLVGSAEIHPAKPPAIGAPRTGKPRTAVPAAPHPPPPSDPAPAPSPDRAPPNPYAH